MRAARMPSPRNKGRGRARANKSPHPERSRGTPHGSSPLTMRLTSGRVAMGSPQTEMSFSDKTSSMSKSPGGWVMAHSAAFSAPWANTARSSAR